MNIVLTYQCNNRCPYCFATPESVISDDTEHNRDRKSMSLSDAAKVASWLAKDQPRDVKFIGGEPFLNNHLGEIIKMFREKCPKSRLTIFTGATVDSQVLKQLSPDDQEILVNVNEPRDYPDSESFSRVLGFIELALASGFRTFLGYNIWRTDFDSEFMPSLAYSLGFLGFRWTVANPNLGGTNKVVFPPKYRHLSKNIIKMLRDCTLKKLKPNLDCHLPLCFFDDNDLAWIARYHPNIITNLGSCSPAIDVTPNLQAMRCFALSKLSHTQIEQHSSVKELRRWFQENQDRKLLSRRGIHENCASCLHFLDGRCQGGCFGWRDINEPGRETTPHMFYTMLQNQEYEKIIKELESASRWFLTPLTLYLGAIAAQRLNNFDLMRRYATNGINHVSDPKLKKKFLELLVIINK